MVADNMKQLEYECYNTIETWLNVHFCYTILILFWLSQLVLLVYPYKLYMWAWPYHSHEQFNEGSEDARMHRFLMFILLELVFMFIYISAALVLTWTFNIGPITLMAFNRWIIEACYGPVIYEIFLYFILTYPVYLPHETATGVFHSQFAGMIRLSLFLVTRYAEFYPASRLNNFPATIFRITCNFSTPHNMDLIPM